MFAIKRRSEIPNTPKIPKSQNQNSNNKMFKKHDLSFCLINFAEATVI